MTGKEKKQLTPQLTSFQLHTTVPNAPNARTSARLFLPWIFVKFNYKNEIRTNEIWAWLTICIEDTYCRPIYIITKCALAATKRTLLRRHRRKRVRKKGSESFSEKSNNSPRHPDAVLLPWLMHEVAIASPPWKTTRATWEGEKSAEVTIVRAGRLSQYRGNKFL